MNRKYCIPILIAIVLAAVLLVFQSPILNLSGRQLSAASQDFPTREYADSGSGLNQNQDTNLDPEHDVAYLIRLGNENNRFTLNAMELIDAEAESFEEEQQGDYILKIRDESGKLIYSRKFVIDPELEINSLLLPYFPQGKAIEIYDKEGNSKIDNGIDISEFSSNEKKILHLKFDNRNVYEAADYSGNENKVTVNGSHYSVNGVFGKALKFDGISDSVTVENNKQLSLEGENTITILAWINLLSRDGQEFQTITRKLAAEYGEPWPYSLNMDRDNKQVQFAISTGQKDKDRFLVVTSDIENGLPLDQWVLVVGLLENNQITLYVCINGICRSDSYDEVSNFIQSSEDPAGENEPRPLYIGASGENEGNFNGIIDDVKVYNYALEDSKIKNLAILGAKSDTHENHLSITGPVITLTPGQFPAQKEKPPVIFVPLTLPEYSIPDFIGVKDTFIGKDIMISGYIDFVYNCPTCPEDAICKACEPNHVILEPYPDSTEDSQIVINFPGNDPVYYTLTPGQEAVFNVHYDQSPTEVVSNNIGWFTKI